MEPLSFGFIQVQNSITNPDTASKDVVDKASPLSFFDFLKYTNQIASPREFNNAYKEYLLAWYALKGIENVTATELVKQQYIDVLRDISLNYTTLEERRFLSNIDFTNPSDLAIAVPFYSKKIRDICLFFAERREKIKHKPESNRIKGTSLALEKTIFGIIVDFLFSDEAASNYYVSNLTLSAIGQSLDIEIESFFDTYSDYFNIQPDVSTSFYKVTDTQREDYFTSNINPIDEDIFLDFDTQLKNDIFSSAIFITELGMPFSINYNSELIDLRCSSENPLEAIIAAETDDSTLKLNLQKRLIQKYIGVDYYYLSTNADMQSVSGILFAADNPTGNLLNRRFPSTATVPNNDFESARELGLFFKPDKQGVLYFVAKNRSVSINTSKLRPNQTYVFPDPAIYGNISNITLDTFDYPLVYSFENDNLVHNRSSHYISGDIKSTPYDQQFHGYIAKQNLHSSHHKNLSGEEIDFSALYNTGVITEWKSDIYGNEYGLIKNKPGNKDIFVQPETSNVNCIIFDGYQFFDEDAGYNFDYSVNDGETFNGSLRTGLTARTIDEIPTEGGNFTDGYTFSGTNMFAITGTEKFMYFREFQPYVECNTIENSLICTVYDGGKFTFNNGDVLPDPYNADGATYDENALYYYTVLVEGGVHSVSNPLTRCIKDSPSLSANMTLSVPISAGALLDGRSFAYGCELTNDYDYIRPSEFFVDTIHTSARTIVDPSTGSAEFNTISNTKALTGILFVKNSSTSAVLPASAVLSPIFAKYNDTVQAELESSIKDFDLVYDKLIITTENYFVIDKIVIDDGVFSAPATRNYYYDLSYNKDFRVITNPFFIEQSREIYFAILDILPSLSATNAKTIYPTIYKFDINKHTSTKIFPPASMSTASISAHFALSGADFNIVRIKQPQLTHNTRNNRYTITYVGEDGNNMGYLFNILFRFIGDDVNIITTSLIKIGTQPFTHNFYNNVETELVETSLNSSATQTITAGTYNFN